ncbi:hypothetical protein GA0111570_105310 [Raineyella antarctica]|uniref:Uncharacterized protein n=1 Tax=Raineyella antarctica TaxID=1577474 RepID=A0A1G6GYV4_9ACTN|nr:hypothetical protein [Raineyella antarctica]SDB87237.1 hypothetical protein GA0111570_105310 [Raineyella antarctica]
MAMEPILEEELRRLRKMPGPLSDTKLLETPGILLGLGRGDPETAMNRLLLLSRQADDDPEIQAAFASFGWGADGDTVLARLQDYAALCGVDARTTRRWSDAGITKLVQLILTAAPWIDPKLGARFHDDDAEGLTLSMRFAVPLHIGMRLPALYENGVTRDITWKRYKQDDRQYYYLATPIRLLLQAPLNLRLEWRGEAKPSMLVEGDLHATVIRVGQNFGSVVTVWLKSRSTTAL